MRPPLADLLEAIGRTLVAIAINLLPRRYRLAWDGRVPVSSTAGASALLTLLLGLAYGGPRFLRYATIAGAAAADAMLATAEAVNQGRAPMAAMPGSYAISMFSLAAFLFFTPAGWVTLYLVGSGLARCLAAAAGEPTGDPLLAGLDAGARGLWRTTVARRAAALREAQEGPPVPDVRLTGRDGGAPEAAWVIVASRRKAGWTEGTFVLDGETRYRIGRPFDRRYPGGLRTVYPLLEAPAAEAMRRIVRCALPAPADAPTGEV